MNTRPVTSTEVNRALKHQDEKFLSHTAAMFERYHILHVSEMLHDYRWSKEPWYRRWFTRKPKWQAPEIVEKVNQPATVEEAEAMKPASPIKVVSR